MKRFICLAIVVAVVLPSAASAFDGQRKGFVLGGGLGVGPVMRISIADADNSEIGLGLNFVIGYAWDEANMIVYEGNVVGRSEDVSPYGSVSIAQGFNGASWYHYFGPKGKTFFTVAGLGFYVYDEENVSGIDPGAGYMIGGGYEFSPHFQAALYFSGGQTSVGPFDFGHNHLNILISAVAF